MVLICFSTASVFAQKFYSQVSSTSIPMGQTIEVAFIAENTNVRGFTPPAFKDFRIVGGPNQSNSTTFINGSRSSTMSFSYYLSPKHEGICIIEAASLKTENSVFNSSQIKVNVTKASTATQSNKNNQTNPTENTEDISNSVFIKLLTNKGEAYIGEPISATFRLYTDRQLFNVQFPKAATFNGFWKHDIAINQNQPWNYENINGKRYAYIDVQKVILFPQKAGKAEITPIGMEAVIQQQTKRKARSFYEELFGGNVTINEIPIQLKSKITSIKVKDFPTNQPADFNGVVGAYTLESSLDKGQLRVDEPFLLKLKITGNGSFQAIEAPIVVLPEEFEIYDPEIKENTSLNGTSVSGSKTFDYLIVPREPGVFELPSIKVVCFNPNNQQFYTLSTTGYTIKIQGDSSIKKAILTTEKPVKKTDLYPIISSLDIDENQSNLLFNSNTYYSLLLSPFVLFLGLFAIKKHTHDSKNNIVLNKKKKASKVAITRLSTAKTFLQDKKKTEFYNEINKAFLEYLSHKLDIASADMNRDLVNNKLTDKHIEQSIIDRCFALIDKTEIALYSQSDSNNNLEITYQESLDVIGVIEEKLK